VLDLAPHLYSIATLRASAQPSLRNVSRKAADAGLAFPIVLGVGRDHPDPPYPLALLRARRERPGTLHCRSA
jgi:hypothetical protein